MCLFRFLPHEFGITDVHDKTNVVFMNIFKDEGDECIGVFSLNGRADRNAILYLQRTLNQIPQLSWLESPLHGELPLKQMGLIITLWWTETDETMTSFGSGFGCWHCGRNWVWEIDRERLETIKFQTRLIKVRQQYAACNTNPCPFYLLRSLNWVFFLKPDALGS